GVILEYYQREVFGNTKEVTTQLVTIGSLRNLLLMVLMVPLNMIYSKVGPKPLLVMSVIMSTGGIILMSNATKLWHLYLFYSVFTGCGASMFQLTVFRVLPQWFDEKRRSTAFGIFFSSTGIGGFIVPFVTTTIESNMDGVWIFRILAITTFALGSFSCVVITGERQSTEQPGGSRKDIKKSVDFSIIKAKNMLLWSIATLIQSSVQGMPNYFLPSYAKFIGLEQWQANMTTAALLGMTIPGAILAGVIADYIGNLNTLISFTTMAALATSVIWILSHNFQTLMAYCAVYGLFANVMLTLNAPVLISIVGLERYPSAISLVLLTNLLSAFGSPLASCIEGVSRIEPYLSYKIIISTGFIASLIIQVVVRIRKEKMLFVKV
ncbi:major facilitator superfamily domain-containing protein, partial [Fennellomyces sp. T-0311]